jgi:hypothetical protein
VCDTHASQQESGQRGGGVAGHPGAVHNTNTQPRYPKQQPKPLRCCTSDVPRRQQLIMGTTPTGEGGAGCQAPHSTHIHVRATRQLSEACTLNPAKRLTHAVCDTHASQQESGQRGGGVAGHPGAAHSTDTQPGCPKQRPEPLPVGSRPSRRLALGTHCQAASSSEWVSRLPAHEYCSRRDPLTDAQPTANASQQPNTTR